MCDDLRTVITDPGFKRDFCQVSAIAEASLLNENRVECEASVDDCVAQLHPTDCDFNDEGNRRGCNATIAELEDCVRDQRDQVQIQAAELSCDNIDAGAAALKEFDINSIPSCARLQTKCPTASI